MSWNNLTPKQLHRRADRVMRFARDMGGSPFDSHTFDAAEQLDSLLGGADPAAVDKAIDEARQGIRDGALSEDTAVERLMNTYGKHSSNSESRLLAAAFHRALGSSKPLAEVFAEVANEQADLPDHSEHETMRLQRDSAALQYARQHGSTPEQFRYSRDEINRGAALASKRNIPFEQAVQLLRNGC